MVSSLTATPVFQKGKWILYPGHQDPMWSSANQLQAASAYATALSKGYEPEESEGLATAYINKQIYKGLVYLKPVEQKLRMFTCLSETS
jgi:hypothetical protein